MLYRSLPGQRLPLSPFVWLIAGVIVVLQLVCAGRYGIFRDEFYYLMCADHLAWGYVDQPPLSIAMLAVWRSILGDSVFAIRLIAAVSHGLLITGTAMLAREMRGKAGAQAAAAVCAGLMPGALVMCSFYSMNSFDMIFWIFTAWIIARLLDDGSRRWWLVLGLVFGLGLLNKYSMVFLGVGLGIGVLLSPLHRELLTRNRLLGTAIVVIIGLPHLIWQIVHRWPSIQFIRNVHDSKNVVMSPAELWGEQFLLAGPVSLLIAVVGVVSLLFFKRLRTWRPLGIAFVVVGIWLTSSHAKPYYLIPAFPMMFAAGAVILESWTARWRRFSRGMAVGFPLLLAVLGMPVVPMAIPLLSVEDFGSYQQMLGMRARDTEKNNETGVLPQYFADRFGWRELAETVAEVYHALPEADQEHCLICTDNYGECGAINYWGPDLGLPAAVSGHNSCSFWWPEKDQWTVCLMVGHSQEAMEYFFESRELGAVRKSDLAMPDERALPVYVCRGWKHPYQEMHRVLQYSH